MDPLSNIITPFRSDCLPPEDCRVPPGLEYEDYYYDQDGDYSEDQDIIVELSERFIAPREEKTRQSSASLEDFNIFTFLRPPPRDEDTEAEVKDIEETVVKNLIPKPKKGDTKTKTEVEVKNIGDVEVEDQEPPAIVADTEVVEDVVESERPRSGCPGESLGECIDVACVSLPQLWVYRVCVGACARRCSR